MKPFIRNLICFAAAATIVGCEWEAPDSDSTWMETGYSWINLNGMYRPSSTVGVLVIDPAVSAEVSIGGTNTSSTALGSTNTVVGLIIAFGDGSSTVLEGILPEQNIVPGTFSVAGGGWIFVDNGDGTLSGTAGAVGTIEYETGRWGLDFQAVAPESATQFIARYQWLNVPDGGSGGSSTNTISWQGNSGKAIFMMYVQQTGNKLVFTDSNGDRYDGILITVNSPGGNSGSISADYHVTGIGRKANVTMTGVFLATYTTQQSMSLNEQIVRRRLGQEVTSSTATLISGRTLTGTWLEHDAAGNVIRSGDIIGFADELTVEQEQQQNINTNLFSL